MLHFILRDSEIVDTSLGNYSISPSKDLRANTVSLDNAGEIIPDIIQTWAGRILDSNGIGMSMPDLDEDLGRCVILCCARDSSDRPDLARLYSYVREALNLRTPDWYQNKYTGKDWESDENIQRLVRECMFDGE